VIAELEGRVSRLSPTHLVVMVGGVGYRVAVTPSTVERATHSRDHMRLLVHTVVRDDAIDLYGFAAEDELDLFELLLTVSGVGPKTALGIIGGAAVDVLREGLASGDAAYLTKVAGVGKKQAERLVLELKGKVGSLGASPVSGTAGGGADAVEALAALGCSDADARAAVAKQDRSLSAEEIVRRALKELGRKV
jgi:Holliday junction DNA helicase RuvA